MGANTGLIIFFSILVGSGMIVYFILMKKQNSNKKAAGNKTTTTTTGVVKDSRRLFADVENIEDGVIVTDGGRRFVAGITCRGLDFYNESSAEQLSVVRGYRQFVNIITSPITYRIYSKAFDIDFAKERYKNRFDELRAEYELCVREAGGAREKGREVPETVENRIRILGHQLQHLTEQMNAMEHYSSTDVVMDDAQEYIFDWTHSASALDVPLTKEEIFAKAKAELSAIAQQKIDALAAAGVKARRCSNSEVVDAFRRISKPITAEQYKQRMVEDSSYDEDIVSSESEGLLETVVVQETQQAIVDGMSDWFAEMSTPGEVKDEEREG